MGISLKKAFKSVGKMLTNPVKMFTTPIEAVSDWAKDFKDWYDGTDAQQHANQLNRENWMLENQYNSPSAQMARYAEAGLNPNLIYSQQNLGGSIGNVQPTSSGAEQISKGIGAIMSAMSLKNLGLQNSMLTTQKDFVSAQLDRYAWDTKWLKEHGLSTFSSVLQRNLSGGLDLFAEPLKILSNILGRASGYIDSTGNVVHIKRNRFENPTEFRSAYNKLNDLGLNVVVDW